MYDTVVVVTFLSPRGAHLLTYIPHALCRGSLSSTYYCTFSFSNLLVMRKIFQHSLYHSKQGFSFPENIVMNNSACLRYSYNIQYLMSKILELLMNALFSELTTPPTGGARDSHHSTLMVFLSYSVGSILPRLHVCKLPTNEYKLDCDCTRY